MDALQDDDLSALELHGLPRLSLAGFEVVVRQLHPLASDQPAEVDLQALGIQRLERFEVVLTLFVSGCVSPGS